MEAWWAEAEAAPGLEAIALYAALEDPAAPAAARPRLLPAALGAAGDNAFVARSARRRRRARRRAAIGGPLPVAFVYAEKYAASASTFLRGRQLARWSPPATRTLRHALHQRPRRACATGWWC